MDAEQIILSARRVLNAEARALESLSSLLTTDFTDAVQLLLSATGKIVTCGVGKAGIIAHKLAATLCSTGSPALFLHPAEAVHGDLGAVSQGDVVIFLSNSGESEEVIALLPALRRRNVTVISIVGNTASRLAQAANLVIAIGTHPEACPLGLAPTVSTTCLMAMGDALAMSLMEYRGFSKDDYAVNHPAGALGKRLTIHVSDIMRKGAGLARVSKSETLMSAMLAISRAGAGTVLVCEEDGTLAGILTDGDVRRLILADRNVLDSRCDDLMVKNPLVIIGDPLAAEALSLFEESEKRPGELPVLDSNRIPIGIITLKDILRAGLV